MMEYNFKLLVGLVIASLLVSLGGVGIALSEKPVDTSNFATKADLNKLNLSVEVPVDPRVDKLCDLTDGCNYYTSTDPAILSVLTDEFSSRDFTRAVSSLTGIDRDYLVIDSVSVLDSKITALTKSDKHKDNWNVQAFVKVKYYDSDREDTKVSTKYFLVSSLLDEGDYDSMKLTEVKRTFEF